LLLQVDESCLTEVTCRVFASLMLLDCDPVPLAELPVALPAAEPVPPDALLPLIAPDPPGTIRPRISTWLFAYLVRFSCCVPATRMYLSPLAALEVPDAAEPLALEPVAEPLVPVPLVPELVPPLIADDPLPIFALVRTNCELLAPAAELDEPVAEPVPVPEVPVAPAMSDDCRHPVTVTCACVLELGVCWLLLVEPDCALSVPASAIERTVPNTTLRFIYTSRSGKPLY